MAARAEKTEAPRVLEVVTVRFAENGITAFVKNMLSAVDPARVSFGLVCPNEPSASDRAMLDARHIPVYVLPMRNRRPLRYLGRLAHIVSDGGYGAVHAHGNSATLYLEMLAAKRGGAHVRIPHSHNTTCSMKAADRLLRPLFAHSYTHALACGEAAGRWLYGARPFTVAQNAVDTARFAYDGDKAEATRASVRAALSIPANAPVYVHVGTFNRQKNHAFLLDCFAALTKRHPGAVLLLLGGGPLADAMATQADAYGIGDQVRFLGPVPDAAPYLSAADAFLLPSLHEGLPFTLLEAQCAGLPCLVSDAVTRDAGLVDTVRFLPLSDGPAAWAAAADALLPDADGQKRKLASQRGVAAVEAAGYGLQSGAEAFTRFLCDAFTARRISVVTHKMTGGGCERVVAQLCNYLSAEGVACTLYTECNVPSFYPLDARVAVVPLLSGERMRAIDVPPVYRKLRRLIRRERPDAVLAMPEKVNVWTVLSLLCTGVPVVVSERNDPCRHPENWLKRLLRRLVYPFASGFLFQTQQAADYFPPRIRARGTVLDNPLDTSRLPAPFTGAREQTVVSAGRLHPQKDYPLLLRAFQAFSARCPGWSLVIYGEGGERDALTRLAAALSLPKGAVRLPGQTDKLAEAILRAGMFVMSSAYEGMPNALIEAMALGLPCISTDCPCGGPASLIRNGENGLLVPPGDADALADAMARLANDAAFAASLGTNALSVRTRMDGTNVLNKWRRYLDRIAVEHK